MTLKVEPGVYTPEKNRFKYTPSYAPVRSLLMFYVGLLPMS